MLSASIWALYFVIGVARAALPACPNTVNAEYDFIVVGAGAGGGPLASRLAESGYSVLLVDAGHDTVNFNTTIPAYNIRSLEDPQIELNYTYQEFPDGFPVTRNDQWYPRARALGGSTVSGPIENGLEKWTCRFTPKIHNAMVNIIAGTRQDYDRLAIMFNDQTWSRDNMQNYFRRIEDNLYLVPLLAPDHGFDGWMKTSTLPVDVFVANPTFLDAQVTALFASLLLAGLPILDLNDLAGDAATGVNTISVTVDETHQRSSIAPGAALPVASNFNGKVTLHVQNVTSRHEVIISAGVFQTPQLLMLSGIGDESQLSQFGIESVVHLPGVGNNLQDHDEVAVNWRLKNNFTLLNGCTFLSDPIKDPCLQDWLTSDHENAYAFAGIFDAVITQSSSSLPAPDILTYYIPALFPGFFRGVPQEVADNPNCLTAVVLKGHPSSRGMVKLTGSHPQDPLDIQKLHFQAPGGPADIAAIRDAIKRARSFVESTPIGLLVDTEIAPGSNVTTDDEIENFIYNRVFGGNLSGTH
ncbi:hypothetical protein C0989_012390 [Termitomyces sp. Mn162]|nr:hypothetical protein C0989_012390 [Termitomyces sp. Mn162]